MSQQINLLQHKQQASPAPLLLALGLVSFTIIVLGVYGWSVTQETRSVRRQVDAGEERLAKLKASTVSVQAQLPGAGAQQAEAELAQLRVRAAGARVLVENVKSAGLGNHAGFSRQFQGLNVAATEGVWLTSVDLARGGGQVSVTGGAVSSARVMQYAKRLNETTGLLGVRFNNLEVLPGAGGAPGDKGPSMVSFKLS
jgi:Tfp pilus assembly protein PilN